MKTLLLITVTLLSTQNFAQASAPIAVYGFGLANLSLDDHDERAQADAVKDAEAKCAPSPVQLAENLGWEMKQQGAQNCPPRHFCNPMPASVLAKAVFVCVANVGR